MNEVYIRADANEIIGTGHIMRCKAIAVELLKINVKVTFIVADERTLECLADDRFDVICMQTIWNELESELSTIKSIIVEKDVKCMLIDDYYVTDNYLREINSITKAFYIDDLNKFEYPIYGLINYNIYAEDMHYESVYQKKNIDTKFWLGTSYIPLREEFGAIKKREWNGINNILITSGGTDNYNMIFNILSRIKSESYFEDKIVYCVIGALNKNRDKIVCEYSRFENIHLLYNVADMSYYMNICDVCVTAGGTTVYELCACGTPSIIYTIADNQLNGAKKMSSLGLMPWAGDARSDIDQCIYNILEDIKDIDNKGKWEEVSRNMQKYVDGKGAYRIALLLLESCE